MSEHCLHSVIVDTVQKLVIDLGYVHTEVFHNDADTTAFMLCIEQYIECDIDLVVKSDVGVIDVWDSRVPYKNIECHSVFLSSPNCFDELASLIGGSTNNAI